MNTTIQASPRLDHDFHSSWGCSYASSSTLTDERLLKLWQDYASNPSIVERKYHQLLGEYTELFSSFFNGYYPISMHAHASDSLTPTTIASLMLNTVATSPLVLESESLRPKVDEKPSETGWRIRSFALEFLGWDERHVLAPTFAAVKGLYGAGFGPLACTNHSFGRLC